MNLRSSGLNMILLNFPVGSNKPENFVVPDFKINHAWKPNLFYWYRWHNIDFFVDNFNPPANTYREILRPFGKLLTHGIVIWIIKHQLGLNLQFMNPDLSMTLWTRHFLMPCQMLAGWKTVMLIYIHLRQEPLLELVYRLPGEFWCIAFISGSLSRNRLP